jgi:hypothetical protein
MIFLLRSAVLQFWATAGVGRKPSQG